jgi:hypothetical protein
VAPSLQVKRLTTSVMASNLDPVVGEECENIDLDTTVGEVARSLNLLAARSLLEAVAATWKVHRLREILPTTSWVPSYSENPITK